MNGRSSPKADEITVGGIVNLTKVSLRMKRPPAKIEDYVPERHPDRGAGQPDACVTGFAFPLRFWLRFASLLGDKQNGHRKFSPKEKTRKRAGDTAAQPLILETLIHTKSGVVRMIDFSAARDQPRHYPDYQRWRRFRHNGADHTVRLRAIVP
jgi:hypothetical protein